MDPDPPFTPFRGLFLGTALKGRSQNNWTISFTNAPSRALVQREDGATKNQHDLASTAGSQTDDFCREGQSAFCRSQSSGPILIDSWLANSQRGREVLGGLGRKARAPSSQHHRNQRVLLLTASWHPLYGLPDGRKLLYLMVFGDGRGRWTSSLLMGSYYPRGLLQDGRDASLPSGANGGLTKPPVWMRLYECR